jgi:hypothetical protein
MPADREPRGEVFDLARTYVHLADGPEARPLEVGADFWARLGARADLQEGRLVSAFTMTRTWDHWEMHPAGDELVVLLAGSIDLVLEAPGGPRRVPLRDRGACLVPRGVWHRAVVHRESEVLHVTRGAGTRHRPVDDAA